MAFNETFTVAVYFDKELKAFSITSMQGVVKIKIVKKSLMVSVFLCLGI